MKIIDRTREYRPDIAVSGDFIVGFPGETDKDFQDTLRIVEEVKYAHAYSFKYSSRPGTPASIMENHIEEDVKSERLKILQARLNEIQRGFGQKMVGSIQRCLVTGISKKRLDQLQARTECNRVINFPFQNIGFIGKLVDIKVEEALAYSLLGTLHNTKELV